MKIKIENEISKTTLQKLRIDLSKAKNETSITVVFDTVGGSVLSGMSIDSELREFAQDNPSIQLTAHIVLAASMGSFLAASPAFSRVTAEDTAVLMVHNPHGTFAGDSKELRKSALTLDGFARTLASQYSRRTGKPVDELLNLMDEESWFFGEEIVNNRFADELVITGNQLDRASAIARAKSGIEPVRAQIAASAAALRETMKNESSILGHDRSGSPMYSHEVRATPHRLFELVSLTPLGHEVINALTAAQTEQLQGPCGISESEYQMQVNQDRARHGLAPLYSKKPAPVRPIDGVIKSEADFQAEIRRHKDLQARGQL